jgi:hypothetical protein
MRLTPAKIEANRQKETSIIYRRRPRAGGDYTYRLRSKGPGANNVKVKNKAKFLLVYKDFLFGFWFSGDFFYPQITWIGADQEPKAKAIHRFRRLHRLEKDKNRDTMWGNRFSVRQRRCNDRNNPQPQFGQRASAPPCAEDIVMSATTPTRSLAGVQAPLAGTQVPALRPGRGGVY